MDTRQETTGTRDMKGYDRKGGYPTETFPKNKKESHSRNLLAGIHTGCMDTRQASRRNYQPGKISGITFI